MKLRQQWHPPTLEELSASQYYCYSAQSDLATVEVKPEEEIAPDPSLPLLSEHLFCQGHPASPLWGGMCCSEACSKINENRE